MDGKRARIERLERERRALVRNRIEDATASAEERITGSVETVLACGATAITIDVAGEGNGLERDHGRRGRRAVARVGKDGSGRGHGVDGRRRRERPPPAHELRRHRKGERRGDRELDRALAGRGRARLPDARPRRTARAHAPGARRRARAWRVPHDRDAGADTAAGDGQRDRDRRRRVRPRTGPGVARPPRPHRRRRASERTTVAGAASRSSGASARTRSRRRRRDPGGSRRPSRGARRRRRR